MRADIVTGATLRDYDLPSHTGERPRLSDPHGPDPLILVLSQGGYCPRDQRQAEGLAPLDGEMEVGYSRLVTICPIASRIALSNSCRRTGFVRNSTAPAFIARTDIGISA